MVEGTYQTHKETLSKRVIESDGSWADWFLMALLRLIAILCTKLCLGGPPLIIKQVSTILPQVRGDEISQQMELGKVINQVTKFVQERVPFPLGNRFTNLCPEIRCGSRTGNITPWPTVAGSIYCCSNHS